MSGFLLDANCASELVRPKLERRVVHWMEAAVRTHLETWLEVELQSRFAGRILPIDGAIADRWGLLAAEAKRKGKVLATIDGLLAATALHHNLTVVSRNAIDFTNTQVQVLNPWEA